MKQILSKPTSLAALLSGPALITFYAMGAKISFVSVEYFLPLLLCLANSIAVLLINDICSKLKKEATLGLMLKLAKSFLLVALLAIALFAGAIENPRFVCFAFLMGYTANLICETLSIKNNSLSKVN